MSFAKILKFTQLFGVLTLALGSSSYAFDLSLLKNDKEAKSHAYNNLEKNMAEKRADASSDKAYALLGETINELEQHRLLCDFNLYQVFASKLGRANIENSPKFILDLLIVWRSKDLIDDVFFEIMEQTSNLSTLVETTHIDRMRNKEMSRSEEIMNDKKLTNDDLKAYYGDFKSLSITNPACSLGNWPRTAGRLAAITKDKNTLRLMNVAALNRSVLTEDEFNLVEFYRVNDVQSWDITLNKYLSILKEAKNKFRDPKPKDADFKTNVLSSKFKDKRAGTTYRASLYYHFNAAQITMLSNLLKKMFDRMDATKTEVVFTFKTGSETLPVSPMGQYYLARKLLRKDMEELSRSSLFAGAQVTHEDLVAAALETGLINADILDSVLKIDDIWNPQVKPWKKVSDYGIRVVGTATLFLPPPFNIISSVALVFIDGLMSKNKTKSNQADASYDIF